MGAEESAARLKGFFDRDGDSDEFRARFFDDFDKPLRFLAARDKVVYDKHVIFGGKAGFRDDEVIDGTRGE